MVNAKLGVSTFLMCAVTTAACGADGTIASSGKPASIRVEGTAQAEGSALVALVLKPLTVAPGEAFLVTVAASGGGAVADTVSFYPPPRVGESRRFLVDVGPPSAGRPLELDVGLVSVDPGRPLEASAVEVTRAEWAR